MASLRKSERLISSRGHGCFTINPPQPMATATRFPSHGSGRPGLELWTATKLSSAGFEPWPFWPLVYESVALKGVQRPAAFATVCFCFCEFRTVGYFGSCGEQVVDFMQSMLVFVLPLTTRPRALPFQNLLIRKASN